MKELKFTISILLIGFAMIGAAIWINVLINSGCELGGIITWEGKKCLPVIK